MCSDNSISARRTMLHSRSEQCNSSGSTGPFSRQFFKTKPKGLNMPPSLKSSLLSSKTVYVGAMVSSSFSV